MSKPVNVLFLYRHLKKGNWHRKETFKIRGMSKPVNVLFLYRHLKKGNGLL